MSDSILRALNRRVLGNDLLHWGLAILVLVAGFALLLAARALLRGPVHRLASRSKRRIDVLLVDLFAGAGSTFLLALVTPAALELLTVSSRVASVVRGAVFLVVLLQIGAWASGALREAVLHRFERDAADDPSRRSAGGVISVGVRALLWAIVVLIALGNFGINISALVAGLGVTGVAVALATQSILGDVFASVSILLDKPFVVGDLIVVGELSGWVEQIGIKTTRVRSIGGEQLVFGNHDLLQSRVRNFKNMSERRVTLPLGVVYDTPPDTLRALPGVLREAVAAAADTRFERAYFKSFGDSALQFELIYYVTTADLGRAMEAQQAVNLGIVERFAARGVEFAFPTQTMVLQRGRPRARDATKGDGAEIHPRG